MFCSKKFELESVRRQKSAEVDAMMRLHHLSFTDACQNVALDPANYIQGEPAIGWLPSPEQINAFAKAVKRGEIIVSSGSQRLDVDSLKVEPNDDAADVLDFLEGSIPEPFEMPKWFGSSSN